MDRKKIVTIFVILLMSVYQVYAQIDSLQSVKKYQAVAPKTQFFGKEAFESNNKTETNYLLNFFKLNGSPGAKT